VFPRYPDHFTVRFMEGAHSRNKDAILVFHGCPSLGDGREDFHKTSILRLSAAREFTNSFYLLERQVKRTG
jgi:hypothetical protein